MKIRGIITKVFNRKPKYITISNKILANKVLNLEKDFTNINFNVIFDDIITVECEGINIKECYNKKDFFKDFI